MNRPSNSDPTPTPPVASPSSSVDAPPPVDRGDEEERPDVLEAMAVFSADGQADDVTGNDAAAAALQPGESDEPDNAEPDRGPHGPN